MSMYFSQPYYYRRSSLAMFAAEPFFAPPPAPFERPPDWGWGQPALFSPPADPPTVRTLSKMVGDHGSDCLPCSGSLLLLLLVKQFDRSAGQTFWERQIIVKSGMNRLSRHVIGLGEFHDTLLMIILHFGGDPSDGHHRGEISLIRCRRCPFSCFAFWKSLIAAFLSKPCLGRPSWQLPGSYEAFYGRDDWFHEIAIRENGGGG